MSYAIGTHDTRAGARRRAIILSSSAGPPGLHSEGRGGVGTSSTKGSKQEDTHSDNGAGRRE